MFIELRYMSTVGVPRFFMNGLAYPEWYYGLIDNWNETALALFFTK